MDVLIVHDRPNAVESIKVILVDGGIEDNRVFVAPDIRIARSLVRKRTFDLMILDLTMPNVQGRDSPGFNQVEDFLREIYDFEDLFAPGDLIGISQESDALQLMHSGLGSHFMVTITEDDDGAWKSQLKDRVRYSSRSTTSKQLSLANQYGVDVLLITAMDEEFSPYKELFDLTESSIFPGVFHFVFSSLSAWLRM